MVDAYYKAEYIGLNLKRFIAKNNLSNKEVQNSLGISSSCQHAWEAGYRNPTATRLPKIAEFIGCDINALFLPPEGS